MMIDNVFLATSLLASYSECY